MDIKILENLLQVTIDRRNLRNRHHQVVQKRILVNLGLLKSGAAEHDRSWKPEKTSWDMIQQIASPIRRKCAFRKVRRDDSRWIGET